jgi:Undecaprenyl-phosphate glucose phosphotransferase
VADAAVVAAASGAAWVARVALIRYPDWWPTSWESYPKQALALATVPITLLSMRFFGLYRPRRDRSLFNESAQVVKACLLAMLAVLAVLYITEANIVSPSAGPDGRLLHATVLGRQLDLDAGRVQLGLLTALLPVALIAHRTLFRVGLRALRRRGWNLRHVAVIGVGRLGQIVAGTLERNSWTGIKVSYFVSHAAHARRSECAGRPVLGGLADLERLMARHKPDAVYVALPAKQAAEMPALLARLDKFPVDVRIVPDVTPRYVPQSMTVGEIDGMPVLSYRESPTAGLGGVTKRAVDVVVGAAALVIFAPVMALIAALVRLSGPGPVIFKQRRVSLGGQVFDIYKFRTMFHARDEQRAGRVGPAAGGAHHPEWTGRDDPRVTPVGRWLRRTSLDELPQLLNVLTGEMSLVGPRPERPELIDRFKEDWRGYMLRQHVKAGMTGWAQINGHRGDSSLRKRLQYDLFYIKNWSLAFDLKILWLTLFRGFVHRNAH